MPKNPDGSGSGRLKLPTRVVRPSGVQGLEGREDRVRLRSSVRLAALRDARDAVANLPVDRMEARGRAASQSAWARHKSAANRTPVAELEPVPGGGTEVGLPGQPANQPTAPNPVAFTRADRAAVSLLLLPLIAVAVAVSAAKVFDRSALQVSQTVPSSVLASPAHVPDVQIATPAATAGQPELAETTPGGGANGAKLAAIAATPLETLRSTPIEDVTVSADPNALIPAITRESEAYNGQERRCTLAEQPIAPGLALLTALARSDASSADFGIALAEAAHEQLGEFVVYTDSYQSLSYPMGDVPSLFGVCTDVIIRAYRTLGVDLQRLVHAARVGSGDKSIDHRRTEVLRRFFAANGRSLPVSDVADDYLPGDVVTYHRPQNSGSQSHIAIVSNQRAASGRPMIIHNRGWGPQLEDALFVNRMTGHYRYRGLSEKVAAGNAGASADAMLPAARRPLKALRKTLINRARARVLRRTEKQLGAERRQATKAPRGS